MARFQRFEYDGVFNYRCTRRARARRSAGWRFAIKWTDRHSPVAFAPLLAWKKLAELTRPPIPLASEGKYFKLFHFVTPCTPFRPDFAWILGNYSIERSFNGKGDSTFLIECDRYEWEFWEHLSQCFVNILYLFVCGRKMCSKVVSAL